MIVSAIAGQSTLAHELGHYLGNHRHSQVARNLMSYLAADGLPVLDDARQRRLARTVRELLKSGEPRRAPKE